jgi:hypothetical protein
MGDQTRQWQKSTASETSNCVEVLIGPDTVEVRNSRDRQGPVLAFTPTEWRAFVTGVKQDEFDLT